MIEVNAGFLGTSEMRINIDRAALYLPRNLRDKLGNDVVISPWFDGCLRIISPTKINQEESCNEAQFFMGYAGIVTPDRKGRLYIGEWMLDYADLKPGDTAIMLGMYDGLELWNRQRLEEFMRVPLNQEVIESFNLIS